MHTHTHTPTCKYNEAIAAFRVAQYAASEQHVLVAEGVFTVFPVQSPTETVKLVVWRLTHHFSCRYTAQEREENMRSHIMKILKQYHIT